MPEELTDEEREAIMVQRREMAGRVDDVLDEIELQAGRAEANGDSKTASQMRSKMAGLRRKREEILSGQRS